MPEQNPPSAEVDRFIAEQIDTVPHLEALLLVWNSRPKAWTIAEMAHSLYVPPELAEGILRDLAQKNLIQDTGTSGDSYAYQSSETRDGFMVQLDRTYRRDLIRVTRMIHAKAPSALSEFARAFRFTKDKEGSKE
ncbi:MAG TPA: hypothetical protein VJ731_15525 [Terriglobales bacterium]|jgi:hypothetical protein|nr:hypothetical protein [Terriglobales bacterium]